MSAEKYTRWEPMSTIPTNFTIDAVHDDVEGIRILLRPETNTRPILRICFDTVIGYRNINESYRGRTWAETKFPKLPGLFIVENSSWVEWVRREAGGLLSGCVLTHYAIYSPEDCIDVISEFPPQADYPSP